MTISRQYGCHGYFLGLLLVDLFNNEPAEKETWRVYQREIVERLSRETDLAPEMLERLRHERPRMLVDFFRNISTNRSLGAYEVRNRIADIIRGLAYEGHCIVIGMGGAGATAGISNGLRVRLEAPKDWRVEQVVETEGLSPIEARLLLQKLDNERDTLRQIYSLRFPREPAFDLVYDCSTFSLAQITKHVIQALKLKNMV
ncbi:MAG: cytidylate kinase family protein [Planctomycetes bacterium]|nr:cytidylate kinase family protein [Planctomycetota bacterium]